jgi:hypothetical protein
MMNLVAHAVRYSRKASLVFLVAVRAAALPCGVDQAVVPRQWQRRWTSYC